MINVRNEKARRSILWRPPTAVKSQRHASPISTKEASRASYASANRALPKRESLQPIASSTPNARTPAFVWNQNGVRQFAINAPAKKVVETVLSNRRRSAAALELELGNARLRPATARHTAMHLCDMRAGCDEAAPRLRPKTARERPSHDVKYLTVAQHMTV